MSIVFSILLILSMLLTSIEIISFNKDFYRSQYTKNGTAHVIGVEENELLHVTDEFFSYLKDRRQDLNIKWSHGDNIFGEREIDHMKDVKQLFSYGFQLRNIAFLLAAILIAILAATCPKIWLKYLSFSFILVSVIVIILAIFMAIGIYKDFDLIWDKFHHIFFSNDLWLLDPNTDVLIVMMPSNFFVDMIKAIAATFFAGMGAMLVFSIYLYRKYRKNQLGLF